MIIKTPSGKMPEEAEKALSNYVKEQEKSMLIFNSTIPAMRVISNLNSEFPDIVRHPIKGRKHWDVNLYWSSVSIQIYCCVGSFNDLIPIAEKFFKLGYTIQEHRDDPLNKSRTYVLYGEFNDICCYLYLVAFTLKELGSTCKVVSLGYDAVPSPTEKFALVCDEVEEAALIQDRDDINYK